MISEDEAKKLLKEWETVAPYMAHIVIKAPKGCYDEKSIRDYLWEEFHLDMGTDPDNDGEYEKLFYGADLRTYSGFLWDDEGNNYTDSGTIELVVLPKYYATDKDMHVLPEDVEFGFEWRKLLGKVLRIHDYRM